MRPCKAEWEERPRRNEDDIGITVVMLKPHMMFVGKFNNPYIDHNNVLGCLRLLVMAFDRITLKRCSNSSIMRQLYWQFRTNGIMSHVNPHLFLELKLKSGLSAKKWFEMVDRCDLWLRCLPPTGSWKLKCREWNADIFWTRGAFSFFSGFTEVFYHRVGSNKLVLLSVIHQCMLVWLAELNVCLA